MPVSGEWVAFSINGTRILNINKKERNLYSYVYHNKEEIQL